VTTNAERGVSPLDDDLRTSSEAFLPPAHRLEHTDIAIRERRELHKLGHERVSGPSVTPGHACPVQPHSGIRHHAPALTYLQLPDAHEVLSGRCYARALNWISFEDRSGSSFDTNDLRGPHVGNAVHGRAG